jgi:hypothetical protein
MPKHTGVEEHPDWDWHDWAQANRASIKWLTRWTFRILGFILLVQVAFGGWNLHLVSEIQTSRREAVRNTCVRENRQNTAIRGFILTSLPAELRGAPLVKTYLHAHSQDFPAATTLKLPRRPSKETANINPVYVVAYLEYTRAVFPRVDCDQRVEDVVGSLR